MNWRLRYRLWSIFRSSLWIVPFAAGVIELLIAAWIHRLDARGVWSGLELGPEGAKALSSTVLTLSLSFLVFTFGSLLVAIQVASGQYTPRIIATTLLRDNVIRCTVGLFVFTLLFAVKALDHTESSVPQLATFLTGILGLACIAAFLYLIDYSARLLRPVSLVSCVGAGGQEVLESVYPEQAKTAVSHPEPKSDATSAFRTTVYPHYSAVVLAVDVKHLLAEAERIDGTIEFVPQVGDFVGTGEPLFHLHGKAQTLDDEILLRTVALGSERTLEQDPLFAFRILVDIAIKALSKAINDPTTAVLAIDQLQRLLKIAGQRNLRTDFLFGSMGQLRVIFRTPDWEDFVHMAATEIRFYGAENVQIARRLRAMFLNLIDTLSHERQPALERELELLDRTIEKLYLLPEDLALARLPDPQGLGGSTRTIRPAGSHRD